MAYLSGKNAIMTINGKMVGCIKTLSFAVTTSTIDATTQCDVKNGILWANNVPNINSWTASGSGLQPFVNSQGQPDEFSMKQLLSAQFSQTKGYLTWEDNTGQFFYGGDVIFTSTTGSSDITDMVSFDFELTGVGPINIVPVS